MINQILSAAIVVVVVGGGAALAVWGWRRRARRQAGVESLPTSPSQLSAATPHAGKYVATTTAGDPYDRIAVRGLAFRGAATVSVTVDGVMIARTGEADVWIAAEHLVGVDRATWTIDRVVETRGLHLIRWRLGDRELDTYLRLDEPAELDHELESVGFALEPLKFPPSKAEQRRAAGQSKHEASAA